MDRLEIKASITVDDAGAITGIAWPFGSGPDRLGNLIEKGAFHQAVADLPMLLAHDPEQPVGFWDEVRETNEGLQVKGHLFIAESRRAKSVGGLIQGGLITGLSIGYKTKASTKQGSNRVISAFWTFTKFLSSAIRRIPRTHFGRQKCQRSYCGGFPTRRRGVLKPKGLKMTKHISPLELKDAGDPTDPVEIVNKSVAELTKLVNHRIGAVETKSVDAEKLTDRLNKLEAKMQRPVTGNADDDKKLERKMERKAKRAGSSSIRSGREGMDAEEIKSLIVSDDPRGGYLAPPEISKELITYLTQFSPVRAAARVGQTASPSVIIPVRTEMTNALWEGEIEAEANPNPLSVKRRYRYSA